MTKEIKRHTVCPHCKKPICTTILTSGTWAFIKSGKSFSPKDQQDLVTQLIKDEGFVIAIKEVAKRVVVEMDEQGFFDHDHTEEGEEKP